MRWIVGYHPSLWVTNFAETRLAPLAKHVPGQMNPAVDPGHVVVVHFDCVNMSLLRCARVVLPMRCVFWIWDAGGTDQFFAIPVQDIL